MMGRVSSALQWWEEWQMRILVLGSLFFHLFLYLSPSPRNRRRLRAVVWIVYIGGDTVAIYALATLFNRNKQTTTGLEVWAPVLLIHLAGHPRISVFSLEDNELWRRQAITLVSQVMVALYVFFRWWSGEKRSMLQVVVLLFIVDIIKFGEKPWGLMRASFSNMLASTGMSPRRRWTCCTLYFLDWLSQIPGEEGEALEEEGIISLQEYVEKAKKYVHEAVAVASDDRHYIKFLHSNAISMMLVDMHAPYSGRLSRLQSLLKLEDEQAHNKLLFDLEYIHTLLYTRSRATLTLVGCCLRYFVYPSLLAASLVLFAKSHKDGYIVKDVWVTYILICCTAMINFSFWYNPCKGESAALQFLDLRVSQYNLMARCVRKKKPTFVMKLATFSGVREYVNKYWHVGREPVSLQIMRLVQLHVRDGWKSYIHDAATYRRFSELKGQRSLGRHRRLLGWSLKMPFDNTVLLWHIATDLCFHQQHHNLASAYTTATTTPLQVGDDDGAMRHSREISNYMIYLLFIQPEMLMPGTRQGIFGDATDDIELDMKDSKEHLHNQQALAGEIIDTLSSSPDDIFDVESLAAAAATTSTGTAKVSVGPVHTAYRLAKGLMGVSDETERWMVIQGVWVEMLCYSASRCRGFLHAKSIGEGFKHLSFIWLLWWTMGMETLGGMYQMSHAEEEEEEAISASTSHSQHDAGQFASIFTTFQ